MGIRAYGILKKNKTIGAEYLSVVARDCKWGKGLIMKGHEKICVCDRIILYLY